uniref:Uncharacterized protein n=1 Tax=Asparagus officinalis TaxID=4686 RepID=Q2AA07_ASPOF|nr:hypothetical protein 20.t00021 [Asparagus officinalis]
MIDLDGCDNSTTNIILAIIGNADEQCNDFRNERLDLVGELLGRELWANIHLKTLWMLIPVKFLQRKLQSNSFRADNRKSVSCLVESCGQIFIFKNTMDVDSRQALTMKATIK